MTQISVLPLHPCHSFGPALSRCEPCCVPGLGSPQAPRWACGLRGRAGTGQVNRHIGSVISGGDTCSKSGAEAESRAESGHRFQGASAKTPLGGRKVEERPGRVGVRAERRHQGRSRLGILVRQTELRAVGRGHVSHSEGVLPSMTPSWKDQGQVSCFSTENGLPDRGETGSAVQMRGEGGLAWARPCGCGFRMC